MKPKIGRRRRSREVALQILFEMEMNDLPPDEAIVLYYGLLDEEDEDLDFDIPMAVRPFAEQIVRGVDLHQAELDHLITSASEHWRIERMSIVDRNVLRIALYEMLHCPEIPPKVSLNEAIDLGKTFGSEDSGSFINGILDHILADLQRQGRVGIPEEPAP